MSGVHSILSPSGAPRRVRCTGALAAAKLAGKLKDVPTIHAASGSFTHWISEQCLNDPTNKTEPQQFIGTTKTLDGFTFTCDSERAGRASFYVDGIRRRPGTRLIEVKLDTSPVIGVEGQGGTGDTIILNRSIKQIEVHDLKDGFGIVYADSEQLLEYGAAALHQFDFHEEWETLLCAIWQPKLDRYDEKIYTIAEVREKMQWVAQQEQAAYRLFMDGTPEEIRAALTPSDKACDWCPISENCSARTNKVLNMFTPAPAQAIDHTNDDLGVALQRIEEIENWCRDIKAEAYRRIDAGQTVKGWKIAIGRQGNRYFKDAAKAAVALPLIIGDDAYEPRQLITPTAAEKLVKRSDPDSWTVIEKWVDRKEPSKALVRDHDLRPAVQQDQPQVQFGIVTPVAEFANGLV